VKLAQATFETIDGQLVNQFKASTMQLAKSGSIYR